jgi:hypothetical protein
MNMDEKELWVRFVEAAVSRYVLPDDVEDAEEVADDMADVAVHFADAMAEEYKKRFDEGAPKRGRRKAKDEDDE